MSHKIENSSHELENMVHKNENMSQLLRSLFKNIFFVQV